VRKGARRSRRRARSRRSAQPIGDAVDLLLTPNYFLSLREAELIERQRRLREALAALNREERLVCLLKEAGFSDAEMADHLRLSVGEVAERLATAKAQLRRAVC
jgi:DNA-directed RNA polymerase specialized sigma24 family protein